MLMRELGDSSTIDVAWTFGFLCDSVPTSDVRYMPSTWRMLRRSRTYEWKTTWIRPFVRESDTCTLHDFLSSVSACTPGITSVVIFNSLPYYSFASKTHYFSTGNGDLG
jgi:hypothetical protein